MGKPSNYFKYHEFRCLVRAQTHALTHAHADTAVLCSRAHCDECVHPSNGHYIMPHIHARTHTYTPPSAIWVRWRCVCACVRDALKSRWVGPSHALRAQWGAWSSSMPVSLKDPWDPACPLEPFIKACQLETITKHFKRHRRTGLSYTQQENLMFLQPQLRGAFSSTEVALFWRGFETLYFLPSTQIWEWWFYCYERK